MHDRPNIVLVMTDQQRVDSLGCYGNRFVETPRIDRLAAEGVVFDRAFTPFPVCTPARASMWTGVYPHTHGIESNVYGVDNLFAEVGRIRRTVFHDLQDAGYSTAYFGKWHLGEKDPGCFDVWDGFNSRGGHWVDGYQSFQGGTWRPTVQTDRCIEFLKSDKAREKPFVMVQSYYPPHHPYTAPQKFYDPYRGKGVPFPGYYASVSALDHETGRILDALDETGQRDNTIFVYYSDHGDTFKYRPDGEHKFVCHEESIRVPFVVHWPGHYEGGRRIASPVLLHDLTPWLLDEADGRRQERVHGKSLRPLLRGDEGDARDVAYVETITRDNKYHQRCLRTENWKLVLSKDGPHMLYDLDNDPEEVLDIHDTPRADVHDQFLRFPDLSGIKRDLATRLLAEARAVDDPLGIELATAVLA